MPAPPNKAVSVLSGGLDSAVATLLARREYEIVLALTFDYGQRAAKREIAAAQHLCRRWNIEHRTIDLPWLTHFTTTALVNRQQSIPSVRCEELDRQPSEDQERAKAVWVPNRNGVFLSIAAAAAESLHAAAIVVGFNAEEGTTFPDNTKAYANAFTTSLAFSTLNQVKVVSPTISLRKVDIVRAAHELDLDISQLWSCYEGGETPCGQCESCARTQRAVKRA